MQIGFGYDVHRLVPGRNLVLGGVKIPFEKGLAGHSDADVLTHAVIDAILGAAGAGDIGRCFPDTEPQYKNISSLILLKQAGGIMKERGLDISNIDAVIVAQAPRLAGYLPAMGELIAHALGIASEKVNIKATTTEGLGFAGAGEGMAAYAVAVLKGA
jgi:2-C-methyl-D-erythritol 2,4-cyclodiphosphate synthase